MKWMGKMVGAGRKQAARFAVSARPFDRQDLRRSKQRQQDGRMAMSLLPEHRFAEETRICASIEM